MLEWMSAPIKRPLSQRQGKALVASTMSEAPGNSMESIDIWVPIGESALRNPALSKQLVEASRLPIDKESRKDWMMADMFSSFYTSFVVVSQHLLLLLAHYFSFLFIFLSL